MEADFGVNDPKAVTEGTHRARKPEETLALASRLFAAAGLTRVANITGLDRIGAPVVMTVRPNARSVSVSQGKGVTLAAAKASGVMEALELWRAETIDAPLRYAPHADIAARAADVARMPRQRGGRFSDDLRMLWIPARNLMGEAELLVPYELVHCDYTAPGPPGQGCFACSTNGLASGNTLDEAMCHAICELIERDAEAVWSHQPEAVRAATRIDPATVDDPVNEATLAAFDAAGLDIAVFDLTSDAGVATYLAVIREPDGETHIGTGKGTHPDRRVALSRALTEAAQTRLTYIAGARDDITLAEYAPEGLAARRAWADSLFALGAPTRRFADTPHVVTEDFSADLGHLMGALEKAGVTQALAVDLSPPDCGLHFARVVAPGLEPPVEDPSSEPGERVRALGGGQ